MSFTPREIAMARLIEYYRGLVPQDPEVHTPPPGYWIEHDATQDTWRYGRLIDGRLETLSGGYPHSEDAVAAANDHLKELKACASISD